MIPLSESDRKLPAIGSFMMRFWIIVFWLVGIGSASYASAQASGAPEQIQIWREERVGHILVGAPRRDSSNPLAYVYYFAAIGPRPALVTKPYGDCLKSSLFRAAEKFRREIVYNLTYWPQEELYEESQLRRTTEALNFARNEYRDAVRQECAAVASGDPFRQYIDGTRLAVVRRECHAGSCKGLAVPPQREARDLSEGKRRQLVFEAIFYWAVGANKDRGLNQVLVLDQATNGGLESRLVETRPGVAWQAPLPATERQQAFEERVVKARELGLPPLSSVIPAQIALPRKTVLRVAAAFEDASVAYALAPDTAELALKILQDETARIRLHECTSYRESGSVVEVAKCAGYDLDQEALVACVSGGPCMPKFDANAQAGAILLAAHQNLEDLARDSFVPRPFNVAKTFGELFADFVTCKEGLDVDKPVDMDKIKACLGKKLISTNMKAQADCLFGSGKSDPLGCVVEGEARQALDLYRNCLEAQNKNCAINVSLPIELACIPGAKGLEDLACMKGGVGDAAKAAQCLKDQDIDYLAKVTCVAGDSLPPEVSSILSCYDANASEAAMAVCVLGKKLPEDQALYVRCAVESGGDFLAAGVCVAAPSLNLDPGQQIILQCAMASGGEPVTFSTCAIGQFTFREFQQCKKVEFGDSGCFGPNNEFQRLAKALTGKTISGSSVVGQVATFYISSVNGAFSGVGNALSQIDRGARNFDRALRREIKYLEKDPVSRIFDAPENVVREVAKGFEKAGKEAGRLFDDVF